MALTTQIRSTFRVQVSRWIAVALIVGSVPFFAFAQTVPTHVGHREGPALPEPRPAIQVDPQAKFQIDKDRRILSALRGKDPSPMRTSLEDHDEFDAYNEVVLHASQFPAAELQEAARLDVSYGDLFAKTREDYRFELIAFRGRLKRLRKIESNDFLREHGIAALYEAWVVPTDETNPVCFLITDKPEGVEPNLDYKSSYPVLASGYFFKLMEYESKEPSEKNKGKYLTRRAPLLMGKSLAVGPVDDLDGGGPWREVFLPALLTSLGLFTIFALGVTWYFRRGDRRSIQILESKKPNPFHESGTEPATGP